MRNNIPTLEDIEICIEDFLNEQDENPRYACDIANGIFSTLLEEYVKPLMLENKEQDEMLKGMACDNIDLSMKLYRLEQANK